MKNMVIKTGLLLLLLVLFFRVYAQPERWQQHIKYNISVNLDVLSNRISGVEKMEYTNNSPDTLYKLYFHLYWNAFQPNSSMDERSRELGKNVFTNRRGEEVRDWDGRVTDRISKLTPNEIGYQKVVSIKVNGIEQKMRAYETILQVSLDKSLLPHSKTSIEIVFEAQVPIQVRRSGRDSKEGIRYSMSQWYPKMVEYDYQGWNANQYIAREFYGVWGDYDVNITIDKRYMVAATGLLQNANSIGYGFENAGIKTTVSKSNTLTWNFKGENIHDFVWAADPNYKHISKKVRNDLTLHVFYKAADATADSAWNNVLWAAEKALPFLERKYGKYPWPQYSFIQGGDGGMEYAMATLLRGPGIEGNAFHEWVHSWYQQLLGTNESLYPWMDEGFTQYADAELSAWYDSTFAPISPYISQVEKNNLKAKVEGAKNKLPINQSDSYVGYFNLAKSGMEEPLTTHADHYNTNYAYSNASYRKGAVFLKQLEYIVGKNSFDKILLAYYNEWKFKHPNPNDFIRVAEKVSGIELQWYKEYWINSTKTIDYAVGDINLVGGKTKITIKRLGYMPMPVEVLLKFKDGSEELHYIPLDLMFGEKIAEDDTIKRIVHKEWYWVNPEYEFETDRNIKDIKSIEIDPSQRMADVKRTNNKLVIPD